MPQPGWERASRIEQRRRTKESDEKKKLGATPINAFSPSSFRHWPPRNFPAAACCGRSAYGPPGAPRHGKRQKPYQRVFVGQVKDRIEREVGGHEDHKRRQRVLLGGHGGGLHRAAFSHSCDEAGGGRRRETEERERERQGRGPFPFFFLVLDGASQAIDE